MARRTKKRLNVQKDKDGKEIIYTTKVERLDILNFARDQMLEGVPHTKICLSMIEKYPHISSTSAAYGYIYKATRMIALNHSMDRLAMYHKGVDRLNHLYEKACEEGDYKLGLEIQAEISKMYGLYSPQLILAKVQHQDLPPEVEKPTRELLKASGMDFITDNMVVLGEDTLTVEAQQIDEAVDDTIQRE
jgi:hypothetical protein